MKLSTKTPTRTVALLFALALLMPYESHSQADPEWLKSWIEASDNRPPDLTPIGFIASNDEPGIPLEIHGQIVRPNGAMAEGVIVHAYHRDAEGFEFGANDDALTTWALQGWAITDAEGRFKFQTIRPAPDHLGREGAHIHFTLETVDFGRQWAPTVFLSDDPLVTSKQRRQSDAAGKFGHVREVSVVDGVQKIAVLFRLNKDADF